MTSALPKLVLLPGLDGTGDLFRWFTGALPPAFDVRIVRYPPDACLSDQELAGIIRSACPASDSFVLLAESYSTALAIRCAAEHPPNLKGLILCAGFSTNPMRLAEGGIGSHLAHVALKLGIPSFAVKTWLLGAGAPPELVRAVQKSISKVRGRVLVDRFQQVVSCDVLSELSKVEGPMLYLRAAGDRLVPQRCLDEILEVKPATKVVLVPGPHLLLQCEPNRTAEVVTNFLLELDQLARNQ